MRPFLVLSLSLLLAACATHTPETIVQQPTTVRPSQAMPQTVANGSIFQLANARPLFEDKLARHVGDIITVQIEERVSASARSGNRAQREGTISNALSAGASSSFFNRTLGGLNISNSSNNEFQGQGESNTSNNFAGSITSSVVEVLGNGNLVIAGEKQLNIRGEVSYLRLSGVINPNDIKAGNMVSSTKIAEARIEEMGSGTVAAANKAGWLQRFFFSFYPF
ncbi:flagellar basal body L-ring protein FlgH [Chitinimonas lacunae]|uniref:Flagellar L-ring protein n=1 Tax=Chitinimonas lacunae TaxID=1963018 RepID=A0ABV8MKE8_9NEIS